jgi:signal transduction histidine kinase
MESGTDLKTWSKWSLRFKWLSLSALITIICVFAGGFITRELTQRERDLQFKMGPHKHHFGVISDLVKSGKFTAEEAFNIVENRGDRGPSRSFLVDENGKVIIATPNGAVPNVDADHVEKLKLDSSHYVIYEKENRSGPPPGAGFGPGPRGHGPPPPGAQLIGIVAIAVSIVVGLALSIVFLTIFIRKKSRQAEEVIARLKTGDLKARFKVNDTDESSQLMLRFNDMAEQIEGLVSSLRDTEKARMTMLQELAHDLRTPVASLKQFQEILLYKGHLLDDEKRKHMQTLAMKEINYFERLVEDLLFLSGVNDPKYSASFHKVNLNELIDEEIDHFDLEKIQIVKNLSDHLIVQGDPHLLKRLLRNAISNAMRFASQKVTIDLKHVQNQAVVIISDDGPGMNESDLKQFGEKKYSRHVDSNISIGLGSVIMKKITSLHDASLSVQNQSIGGLELTIKFPLV